MPETPNFIRSRTVERTQTFQQEVPDVTKVAEAKSRLAGSLSGFFKPAIDQEGENQRQESLYRIRRENEDLGRAAIQRVLKSPKEAREAVRKGDLAPFAPNEEALGRRAFVDTFKTTAGALGADDVAENAWKERLRNLPLDGDPRAIRDSLAKEELGENADPLFEQSFLERYLEKTDQDISQWQADRAKQNAALSLTRRQDVFENDLRTGNIEPTLEELQRLYGEFSNAGGLLGIDGRLQAVETFEQSIIREASRENNGVALKLLQMPNPDRDGLSIAERHPELVDKAIQESVARFNQVKSLEAHQDLVTSRDLLKALQAGSPDVSPADILSRMGHHRNTFGFSNEWEQTYNQVWNALKGQADHQGVFADISNGRTPLLAQKDWNKAATQVYNNYASQCASQGGDPVSCQAQALTAIARRGTGDELRDFLSAVVIGGSDEDFTTHFGNLSAMLEEVPGVDVSGHILEDDAANMFLGIRALVKGGRSPLEARELLRTAPSNVPFGNHLSAQQGRGFTRDEVQKSTERTWKKVRAALKKQDYDVPRNFDDLSPELKGLIQSNLNLSSWMRHASNAPIGELEAMAAEMTAGRVDLSIEDGDTKPVLRRQPASAVMSDGTTAHIRRYGKSDLKEAMDYIEKVDDPGLSSLRAVFGDTLTGLRPDALTEQNMGMAVLTNQAGFTEETALPVGHVYRVPRDELEGDARSMLGFFDVIDDPDDPDMVVLRVPDRDQPIQVDGGQRVYMVRDDQAWRMRYLGQPIITQEMVATGEAAALETAERSLERARQHPLEEQFEEFDRRSMEAGRLIWNGALSGQTMSRGGNEFFASGYPDNYRQLLDNAATEMASRGGVKSSTVTNNSLGREIETIEDARAAMEQMFLDERTDGSFMDNLGGPGAENFLNNFTEFMIPLEGQAEWAYDDHTGRRLQPGESAKGDPTVGIGLNLTHPRSDAWLGAVGLDPTKVKSGQQMVSPQQSRNLLAFHATDTAKWLQNHFKEELGKLNNHHWMALMSLAMNSRWNRRGPTLIGPRLTAAIKNGDMEAAAKEIRDNSSGGVPKRLKRGIRARRQKEASMFLGDYLNRPKDSIFSMVKTGISMSF